MAKFEIIAGDFGQNQTGQVLVGSPYRQSAQGFQMPIAGRSFQTVHIPCGQIETLDVATEENLKKMGGAIGWGLVGGISFGTVGALAGVLKGGNKKEVTFVCKFRDGRGFLGRCDAKSFTAIQAASFAPVAPVRNTQSIPETVEPQIKVLRQPCAEERHYACGYRDCSCPCHEKTRKKPPSRSALVVAAAFLITIVILVALMLMRP